MQVEMGLSELDDDHHAVDVAGSRKDPIGRREVVHKATGQGRKNPLAPVVGIGGSVPPAQILDASLARERYHGPVVCQLELLPDGELGSDREDPQSDPTAI
jgi:hypothetical protein